MGLGTLHHLPVLLLLAGSAGLLPLPADGPPPVAHDASGIAWDLQADEDGTRSLRVGCQPGRRYTVEQSSDLVQWTPLRSWTGLAPGQVVAVDLFVGPPPAAGGGAPPPAGSGAMPLTASLAVQPVDDGSTALCWWRGGSSSYVRILEPASGGSWGPPTLTTLHVMELDGWTVLLQSSDLLWRHSSLALPPADPPLAPEDAAFHAVLLANRAAIAAAIQGIHDNQQAALEYARLHGAPPAPPTAGCFFRVREESGIDTDGDGLTDEQELALGLNIFFTDTDGDGMDDAWEVRHGLDARNDSDASADADGDGDTNLAEYIAGTDASNPDDFPAQMCSILNAALGGSSSSSAGTLRFFRWDDVPVANESLFEGLTLATMESAVEAMPLPQTLCEALQLSPPSIRHDPIGRSFGFYHSGSASFYRSATAPVAQACYNNARLWVRAPARPVAQVFHFFKVTSHSNGGTGTITSIEPLVFTIPANDTESGFIDLKTSTQDEAGVTHTTTVSVRRLGFDADYNRDGRIDDEDNTPVIDLAAQGAYDTATAPHTFRQKGAIVWTNLDHDEERIAGGKPVPDTIRFWHNGIAFESSDEDYRITNGERTIAPYLIGYLAPPPGEIRSPCPDIYPIRIERLVGLLAPTDRVLLRVAQAGDVRAFHLFKRIPDFSKKDAEEVAVWGSFAPPGPSVPWHGQPHVLDEHTIDLTKWLNEASSDYVGHLETRREPCDPVVFGIEAMLHKGMRYDFTQPDNGSTFDGQVDFSLVKRNAQGQETEIDKLRLTFLRLPAFPGAQGFGKWSQGGRGGEVYKVTNLNDSGPGSLRDGITTRSNLPEADFPGTERKKPRTIVFEAGGRIHLGQQDELNISRGLLTIAGQTVSGEGITLTDATFRVSGSGQAVGKAINKPNDVIIRYLRSRRATSVSPGKDPNSSTDYPMGSDAFEIKSSSRVIVDHCSFSGGIDGSMDIVQGNQAANEQPEMDVTAQWCFVHHTLDPHSKSSLIRGKFGARYSIIGCFYGHNEMRNPEVGWLNAPGPSDSQRMLVEFSDNVVYNWRDQYCGDTQSPTGCVPSLLHLQFLANYYKPGNDTDDPVIAFQIQSTGDTLYFENNRMRGSVWPNAYEFVGNHGAANKASSQFITHFTSTGNALTARDKVRIHGGCSRGRDLADTAYVNEVPPGTENPKYAVTDTIPSALISAYALSGASSGYVDGDNDGMADSWESGYAGSDGVCKFLPWKDDDGDGWTNLEEYINKTNPMVGDDSMKAVESNVDGPLF